MPSKLSRHHFGWTRNVLRGVFSRYSIVAFLSVLGLAIVATAGSLTPSASPASTFHTLGEIYASLASAAFDSSSLSGSSSGSLIQHLKYVEANLSWASGSSNIWSLATGNVGVGTVSPTTKLDIRGNASVSANFEAGGTASISGTTTLKGVTYTWPSAQGSAGNVLKNNGSGTLSWGIGLASNSLDFDEFVNGMTLDTNLAVASAGFNIDWNRTNFGNIGTASVSKQLIVRGIGVTSGSVASLSATSLTTGNAISLRLPASGWTGNILQALDTNGRTLASLSAGGNWEMIGYASVSRLTIGGGSPVAYNLLGATTSTHTNYMAAANDMLVGGDLSVLGTASFAGFASISNTLYTSSSGIGNTSSLSASAILSLVSTTKGLLPPRMTTTQKNAISNPSMGLVLFDATLSKLNVYNGTTWKNVGSSEIGGEVTSGTSGSILYVDSGGLLAQDNSNLFWNATNRRLGLGTITPTSLLTLVDSGLGSAATGSFAIRSSNTLGSVASISATSLTTGNAISLRLPASGWTGNILQALDTSGRTLASLSAGGNWETIGYASVGGNATFSGTGSSSFAGSMDITKGLRASNFTQVGTQQSYFNGNVGIGTVSPLTRLEVQGTASASNLLTVGSLQVANGGATVSYSRFGTTATTHTNYISAANDLLISGDLSVLGTVSFAGFASVSNTFTVNNNTLTVTSTASFQGPTIIANGTLGALTFDSDAGMVSWVDMPVTSSLSADTVERYTAQLDGNPMLTIYGRANGNTGIAGSIHHRGVGIGTFTPRGFFSIVASESGYAAASASFTLDSNMTTGSVASISALSLAGGSVFNIIVPASTSANNPHGLMLVQSSAGATIASWSMGGTLSLAGKILSDGANSSCTGVNQGGSGCLDYAESFPTADPTLQAGEVVAVSPTASSGSVSVVRAVMGTFKSGEKVPIGGVIGIVSANPAAMITGAGILSGSSARESPEGTVPIALAGRVPVRFSLENGDVEPGDHLTLSAALPGFAMKQTDPGQSIGIALEASDPVEGQTILTFVNLSYWAPAVPTSSGDELIGSWSFRRMFSMVVNAFADILRIAFGDGSITTGTVKTSTFCIDATCITESQLRDLLQRSRVAPAETQSPSPSPTTSVEVEPQTPFPEVQPRETESQTLSPTASVSPDISPTPTPEVVSDLESPTATPSPSDTPTPSGEDERVKLSQTPEPQTASDIEPQETPSE